MTNKPFDPTKPVQTRDGRKARIICTDRQGERPVVALINHEGLLPVEVIISFHEDGRAVPGENTPADLINVPARIHREVWVNIHKSGAINVFTSKASADFEASWGGGRDACIPITIDCEEGEGLSERA